jgi:hypothetical protein
VEEITRLGRDELGLSPQAESRRGQLMGRLDHPDRDSPHRRIFRREAVLLPR